MKTFLVCLCLVAAVLGETCRRSSDCKDTTCSGHQTVCHHFGGGFGGNLLPGECICSEGSSGTKCTSMSDCGTSGCSSGRTWHCVDGECHCGFRG